ncbi:MAG TPA: hypothetical protein PKY96_04225 [Flavobacteriales bacterium]|nr:hypothetical protein [Flavobacteriales bacterium]
MSRRAPLLLFLVLVAMALRAQDPLVEALRKYQAGDLQGSRVLVDAAVASTQHAANAEAWLLRGFVYKDLYKAKSGTREGDAARDSALASLYRTVVMDKDSTYRDNAVQAYDFLTRSCYNEAAKALADGQDARAVELFDTYRESVIRLKPQADLRTREAEFANALGTLYTKRFNEDRTRTEWFEKATDTYRGVLRIDPDNYGANYNLATLFYNMGVYRIRALQAEADLITMQQVQEVAREYFQLALPFMLKAHDMNPARRETLLGLEGIYYSLQDEMNSDRFRELYESLPQQEDR